MSATASGPNGRITARTVSKRVPPNEGNARTGLITTTVRRAVTKSARTGLITTTARRAVTKIARVLPAPRAGMRLRVGLPATEIDRSFRAGTRGFTARAGIARRGRGGSSGRAGVARSRAVTTIVRVMTSTRALSATTTAIMTGLPAKSGGPAANALPATAITMTVLAATAFTATAFTATAIITAGMATIGTAVATVTMAGNGATTAIGRSRGRSGSAGVMKSWRHCRPARRSSRF